MDRVLNTAEISPTGTRRTAFDRPGVIALVLGLVVLVRVPYFATHHVQEDSYITWRCAKTLLQTGVYGFNPSERVSASTAHAYVLLAAAVMAVAGDHFIPVLLTLNTIMCVAGIFLICRRLLPDRRRAVLTCVAVGLMPVTLLTTYAGMETGLLILLVGLALDGGLAGRGWAGGVAAGAFFLMPWTRPDAVAYQGLLLAALWIARRRPPFLWAVAAAAGGVTLLLFNRLYFGTFLNQTILAKALAYPTPRGPAAIAGRLKSVFLGGDGIAGLFSPLATRYLLPLGGVFLAAAAGVLIAYLRSAWHARRDAAGRERAVVGGWLSATALLVPAAYAGGGIIFPWYLWPASVFGWVVVWAFVIDRLDDRPPPWRRAGLAAAAAGLAVLACGQWFLAVNWGTQEYRYRASIGRVIRAESKATDTLFLEPAGYIPYFAERYTWDEVGLVSPPVSDYRRRFGRAWFVEFIRRQRPTYVVQKRPFRTAGITDCDGPLDAAERDWFAAHYDHARAFDYDPADYHSSPTILRICRMGSAAGYDLYRAKAGVP